MASSPLKTFRAGCDRTREGPRDLRDFAYTDLAYPECPDCPHRLEPEDGKPFCRWLDVTRENPFAALAAFRESVPE
jgi:hypothetical protein